jgi:BirA family biotin operon repressor/biotin-[acetyl-CoA-carboxylase] ligase
MTAGTHPIAAGAVSTSWLARLERLAVVGSTNDIVLGWLRDDTPEVCVAIADEQTAGRGRSGRSWTAPSGSSLLLSVGFRPTYLEPEHAWRLAAIVSLAMAEAAEAAGGLPAGVVRLKWPNDLVVFDGPGAVPRKLAGVLGETRELGTDHPQAVIGIGTNVDWSNAAVPADLVPLMTTLSEVAGRQVPIDRLADAFLEHLEPLVTQLRDGSFPSEAWRARQATSGAIVRLERPDGAVEVVRAVDVDPDSGALIVESPLGEWPARAITVGEIRHLRMAEV